MRMMLQARKLEKHGILSNSHPATSVIPIPHAQERTGWCVGSLSLLPGGPIGTSNGHVHSAAGPGRRGVECVSVPGHCIDAEVQAPHRPGTRATGCYQAPGLRAPTAGTCTSPMEGGHRRRIRGRTDWSRHSVPGSMSSRRVGTLVVVVPTVPVSLAVTNKLICTLKGPSTVTS